ncbi:prolipoprotein diacylglyceryl transferase [Bacillus sp. SD088]|uniref:prolipoprotein diacylglyceryl transferase n=1 Tax=Bacillus sp. SD088 TaxID=2782012 RepID=UPI001A96D17D|nr:prolipoprotein diacylglyceryl transferase family protein [Bacillus sp. SD088]MBO0991460.1 prolipoprotein diacylglyceryl transferase [Bacillus sp. SD088]
MEFPVWINLGLFTLHPHVVFEALGYFLGFRFYLFSRRSERLSPSVSLSVLAGAIVGAALGSKMLAWFYDWGVLWNHLQQPLADPGFWMKGKSIVGGLLGGLIGVELAKKLVGHTESTGDDLTLPLITGMAIGRIGCFLTGIEDNTYGIATTLPWGIDFGDGILRHPTQLYELLFLVILGIILFLKNKLPHQEGDLFKLFMVSYLLFRFVVDFIKPYPREYLGLGSIQVACLLGILYYAKDIPRLLGLLRKRRNFKEESA